MSDDPLEHVLIRALSGRTVFRSKDFLRPDYVPERLPFRERQVVALGEVLAPILHRSRSSNVLLYGKTGTGKTAVARYVLGRVRDKSLQAGFSLHVAYCNTRMAGTQYRVMANIAGAIGLRVPFTGLAVTELSNRILGRIAELNSHVIVVLDEIDFLVKHFGDNTLYDLTRAGERMSGVSLGLVGISNDLGFKDYLDPRVLSSLSEEEIVFPPYTAEELRSILLERVRSAFLDGVFTEAALSLCAALAGSEHGDARRAVDLLRVSGEVVEREGADRVEERHVRIAVQKIEQDRMVESLRSLPFHQKLVLLAAASSEAGTSTGEVYDHYAALCKMLGSESLTQRRVSSLLTELDLVGLVSVRVVSQGRYGRTKKVNSLVSPDSLRQVLSEDPTVGPVTR